MGIEKWSNQSTVSNRVRLRFQGVTEEKHWYGIQPDVSVFPLYCDRCEKQQSDFYVHTGSRYGFVGAIKCEFCGSEMVVTDHDNIVDAIILNQNEISFSELYLLQWTYIKALEEQFGVSIGTVLKPLDGEFISVDSLRNRIELAIGVATAGTMQFITDVRFQNLPTDVNRWIELLYKAGIPLGIEPCGRT